MHRSMTLKQRISLGLAAFLLALSAQIFLSFYQSGAVMQKLDDQMGQFNAISRFQGGVERSLTTLADYRWEFGDADTAPSVRRNTCCPSPPPLASILSSSVSSWF